MIPTRPRQTPEDRARETEGALDWMRNTGVTAFEEYSPAFQPSNDDSGPSLNQHSPGKPAKDLDYVMTWMHNGKTILMTQLVI
jgi:hypothetical protein